MADGCLQLRGHEAEAAFALRQAVPAFHLHTQYKKWLVFSKNIEYTSLAFNLSKAYSLQAIAASIAYP